MNYKQGYKGDDLKQYQTKLGIQSDGVFGKQTNQAVKDFQGKNNLVVDGIIGKNTINAFNKPVEQKKDNVIDVNTIDKVSKLDTAGIPEPTEGVVPIIPTIESIYTPTVKKEKSEAQLKRENIQNRITELQGGKNLDSLKTEEGNRLDINRKENNLNELTNRYNQLVQREKSIPIELQQEQNASMTKVGVRPKLTSELRKNALEAMSVGALLSAAQGQYDSAKNQADKAASLRFESVKNEIAQQEQQLEFLRPILEKENSRDLAILQSKLEDRKNSIRLQEAERKNINNIGLELAKRNVPVDVLSEIMESKNYGEAIKKASKYLTKPELNTVKQTYNKVNGLTGNETIKPNVLKSLTGEKEEIAKYIMEKFPENPDVALAIAMEESSGLNSSIQSNYRYKTDKYGDVGSQEKSYGIFQIHEPSHQDKIAGRDLTDWKTNIDIAREIYDEAGGKFNDWSAFNNGSYKKNLNNKPVQDPDILIARIGKMVYGTRISDAESKRIENIVGRNPDLSMVGLTQKMLGYDVTNEEKKPLADELLNTLMAVSGEKGLADYDLVGLSKLINDNKDDLAINKIEKTAFLNTDKNYLKKQKFGEEVSRKIKDISELIDEVDIDDLGSFDARTVEFSRFFDNADPKTTELEAKLVALFQPYRLENLGSAVTETELKAIKPLMATLKDQPELLKVKLEEFLTSAIIELNSAREVSGLPDTSYDILVGNKERSSAYVNELDNQNAPEENTNPLVSGLIENNKEVEDIISSRYDKKGLKDLSGRGIFSTLKPKEIIDEDNSLWDKITSSIQKRGERIREIGNQQKDSGLERGLQGVGQAAAGVGDVAIDTILSIPVVGDVLESALNYIGETDTVQEAMDSYKGWARENPRDARNLEGVVNIGSILPVGKAAGVVAKNTVKLTNKGLKLIGNKLPEASTNVTKAYEKALSFAEPKLKGKDLAKALSQGRGTERFLRGGKIKMTKFDEEVMKEVATVLEKNPKAKHISDKIRIIRDEIGDIDNNIKAELEHSDIKITKKELKSKLDNIIDDIELDYLSTDDAIGKQYSNLVNKFTNRFKDGDIKVIDLFNARQEFDRVLNNAGVFQGKETAGKTIAKSIRSKVNELIDSKLPKDKLDLKDNLSREHKLFNGIDNAVKNTMPEYSKNFVDKITRMYSTHPAVGTSVLAGSLIGANILAPVLAPATIAGLALYGTYKVGNKIITNEMVNNTLKHILKTSSDSLTKLEKAKVDDLIKITGKGIGDKIKKGFNNQGGHVNFDVDLKSGKDLVSEAKKYKTADEFIEAQPKVYHGQAETDKYEFMSDTNKPVWTTTDKYIAESYAFNGKIGELYPEVKKTLDLNNRDKKQKFIKDLFANKQNKDIWQEFKKYADNIGLNHDKATKQDFNKFVSEFTKDFDREKWNEFSKIANETWSINHEVNKDFIYNNWDTIIKKAKQDGYDSIKHTTQSSTGRDGITGNELVVFNPKNIKTKSQLKKIWEEVNKK